LFFPLSYHENKKYTMKFPSDQNLLRMFSSRIRTRRHELKLTQEEVSELVECSPNAYGNIERAQADPCLTMVFRICKALKISIKDVIPV
jgi:DNA-binding XRE family transcriptional regulator